MLELMPMLWAVTPREHISKRRRREHISKRRRREHISNTGVDAHALGCHAKRTH